MSVETGWNRRAVLRGAVRTFAGAGVIASVGPLLDQLYAVEERASPLDARVPDGNVGSAIPITGNAAADRMLAAALDAIFPAAGRGPSATQARLVDHLAAVAAASEFQNLRDHWIKSTGLLNALARDNGSREFSDLPVPLAADMLVTCLSGNAGASLHALALSLLEFAIEGYFGHPRHGGNPNGTVWQAYGLQQMVATLDGGAHHAHPQGEGAAPVIDSERLLRRRWDVVIVGSGAGGSALAWRLATRGLTVLVLEKGKRIDRGAPIHDEITATRRNLFVPYVKDEPHVVVPQPGAAPEKRRDGWTACCVGGGTVHMSAMLMRMHPPDFAGADGQAPWPFGYEVLAPYYDLVERFVGVSGDRAANPFAAPGPQLPLPPIATHPAMQRVAATARAAGMHPYPTPRGILSRAYEGRNACVYCPFCASYACETDAKASADVTFLRRAEATRRAFVLSGVRVTAIRATSKRAEGVEMIDAAGMQRTVSARIVVLAAGVVESARLALLSVSTSARKGVGNQRDQVGRHLTGSYNAGIAGRFEYPGDLFSAADDEQPFLNLALQDLYAAGCGTIVLDRRPASPIHHAVTIATAGPPVVGAQLKERLFLQLARSRDLVVESFIPMRPHEERRVTVDDRITDAWRRSVGRITFARHSDDAGRGRRVVEVGEKLLRGAGTAECNLAIDLEETPFLLCGSMRMGRDVAASATDAHGGVHGLANLYVCDGSTLPGMGGVPPSLTIMANAIRLGDTILARNR